MSVVIVAIPREDDYVWKISSEKIPHMTLLFLGESLPDDDAAEITKFLEHASNFTLDRFWLDVEKRGTLGEDEADVLFFRKSEWNIKVINQFRGALLQNDLIKKAYDSAEQFPEWNPHLTLGYPETPAKPDNRDNPGFFSVNFDRIALWFGDYEGPTFDLKDRDWDLEVSMDASTAIERVLSHYGVKGMKWGQRASDALAGRAAKKVAKKDKKFEKDARTLKKFLEVNNKAADHFNSRIGALNAKHPSDFSKEDFGNPSKWSPAYKKYNNDVMALQRQSLEHAVTGMTNASGTRKIQFTQGKTAEDGFSIHTEDVKHAETMRVRVVLNRDTSGKIVSVEFKEDEIAQGALAVENVLSHYGVKGMRWGQRKTETTSVKVSQKGKKLKTEGGTGKKAHEDAIRKATIGQTKKKSGVNALSDKDLQAYANRLQLEQRVKGLEYSQKSAPRKFIANILGNSGKQYANQLGNEASQAAAKKTIAMAAAKQAARKTVVGV